MEFVEMMEYWEQWLTEMTEEDLKDLISLIRRVDKNHKRMKDKTIIQRILKGIDLEALYRIKIPKGNSLERFFLRHPSTASYYATTQLGKRWLKAEPIILQDPKVAIDYFNTLMHYPTNWREWQSEEEKLKWPEGEKVFKNDATIAAKYARITNQRFFAGEEAIAKDKKESERYLNVLASLKTSTFHSRIVELIHEHLPEQPETGEECEELV